MATQPNGVAAIGTHRSGSYNDKVLCPRCQSRLLPITYAGALDRVDNVTEVCSECGLHQALRNVQRNGEGTPETHEDWPVVYMPSVAPDEIRAALTRVPLSSLTANDEPPGN